MTIHEEKAKDLFLQGYNCAQAVFAAFCDMTHIPQEQALKLSSSFGGGIGRLREVCGAVSGMEMALGALTGYASSNDKEEKTAHYARVRLLAEAFRTEFGSIVCRELLGPEADSSTPVPTDRNAAFFHNRNCLACVTSAARILDEYLAKEGLL
ncbi:MAG: C_GCAxxG_C_C family protein [Clostridia bacterium]|nr:C_GCAxxG_C_C family protein [Clostridia bacterium]